MAEMRLPSEGVCPAMRPACFVVFPFIRCPIGIGSADEQSARIVAKPRFSNRGAERHKVAFRVVMPLRRDTFVLSFDQLTRRIPLVTRYPAVDVRQLQ